MNPIDVFVKDLEEKIFKEGFSRWNPDIQGRYFRANEEYVDWIMSLTFSERYGRPGIIAYRCYYEIEALLDFVIPGKLLNFNTFLLTVDSSKTDSQFAYDQNGAIAASEFLYDKVFNNFHPKFDQTNSIEELFLTHQASPVDFFLVGLEPGKGRYGAYRALLLTKLFSPESYEPLFEEVSQNFNTTAQNYLKDLNDRGRLDTFSLSPRKTITSKLGRLDAFLNLMKFESFDNLQKEIVDAFKGKLVV